MSPKEMEHEGRDYDYCAREVLADALAQILPDSNFAQELAQENMTWVEQIIDMLKKFIADIKAALKGIDPVENAPHVDIRENIDGSLQYLEEIRQMYDKLAAGAVQNYQAAMETETQKNTTQEGSVSHSIKRTRRMTLQEQLSAYYDKAFYQSDSFYFGNTPSDLTRSGLESHPLAMMQDDFKKSTRTKHNIPRRVLKKLHSAISHPVFSFTAGKQVAIMTTEIDGDGKPVVVAIHGGHNMDRKPVNVIKSIYGVDSVADWVGQQIDGGSKFRVYDIEKTTAMLQTQGYLAAVGAESDGSWDTITQTNVGVKEENAAQGKEAKISHHARPSIKDPEKLDPRTVTEADVLKMLNDVRAGKYYDNTYIPVRINTPTVLIYWAKERLGDVIDNNPIAISAGKAYQAMARSGEDIDGTPHELSPEDIVEIIRTMNKPRYIIFQGENERYAEVIQYETSTNKKAVAVLDVGFHKAEWTMNGFEAGLYNILVTTFPPDVGIVESMLSKKGNVVIFDSEKDASRSAPGSNVPSDSSDTPFYEDSIIQEKEVVKSEEKDMASISGKKRGTTLSDREVLEVAALRMDTSTLTEGEQTALNIFKERLAKLRELQIERERLGSLWHEQQFGSGDRSEAPKTLNRMQVLDGQIERAVNSVLSVEDKQVLRDVLQKAREYVKEQSVDHYRGILERRKDRSTQAQLRQKLHSTVHELSQLLLHGDKNHHVPESMKKAVAGALDVIINTAPSQRGCI